MTPTDERRARALDPRAFETAPELSKEDAERRRRIALAEARMRRKFDESIDLATYDTRTHVAVPREPTEKMLANILDGEGRTRILEFTTPEERHQPHLMSKAIYRAMLAALEGDTE